MCELGSQGGLDGRWHCSAAQVEALLFQHADVLPFMLSLPCLLPFVSHPLPLLCVRVHHFCQQALSMDCETSGAKKGRVRGRGGALLDISL